MEATGSVTYTRDDAVPAGGAPAWALERAYALVKPPERVVAVWIVPEDLLSRVTCDQCVWKFANPCCWPLAPCVLASCMSSRGILADTVYIVTDQKLYRSLGGEHCECDWPPSEYSDTHWSLPLKSGSVPLSELSFDSGSAVCLEAGGEWRARNADFPGLRFCKYRQLLLKLPNGHPLAHYGKVTITKWNLLESSTRREPPGLDSAIPYQAEPLTKQVTVVPHWKMQMLVDDPRTALQVLLTTETAACLPGCEPKASAPSAATPQQIERDHTAVDSGANRNAAMDAALVRLDRLLAAGEITQSDYDGLKERHQRARGRV